MSEPKPNLLDRLRPAVLPFARYNIKNPNNKKLVAIGEAISFEDQLVHVNKDEPKTVIITTLDNLSMESRYLWIIDEFGNLSIILETTSNPEAARKCVCHSNMTGGREALQGGEVWFLSPKSIVLNFRSGRYGAETPDHEKAVVEYWEFFDFTVKLDE